MQFDEPLALGTLHRRYKRFLADIRLDSGEEITAHVANSGSMRGCAEPGARVALSYHGGGKRKFPWSWELVDVGGTWASIHTGRANSIVEEAIAAGRIASLRGYREIRREVKYGSRNSRIDLLLSHPQRPRCWVEVKNVTMAQGRRALFPDAVTERGKKHLLELRDMVAAGDRGVIFFLVNRGDCTRMSPAAEIDPAYTRTLAEAKEAGVEILAYRTRVSPEAIEVERRLPVELP